MTTRQERAQREAEQALREAGAPLGVVLNPADIPSGDVRPIYDAQNLPGGPWNRYRPRTWVNAFRITGPWLFRLPNGLLSEQGPVWVIANPVTGALSLATPQEFADTYEIME